MHSIFQIRISRSTKCAHKTGFPRLGHICKYISVAVINYVCMYVYGIAQFKLHTFLAIVVCRFFEFLVCAVILDP